MRAVFGPDGQPSGTGLIIKSVGGMPALMLVNVSKRLYSVSEVMSTIVAISMSFRMFYALRSTVLVPISAMKSVVSSSQLTVI